MSARLNSKFPDKPAGAERKKSDGPFDSERFPTKTNDGVSKLLEALTGEDADIEATYAALISARKLALDTKVFAQDMEPTLPLICRRMKKHIDDLKVQKLATLAIASLGEKKNLRTQIAESGTLKQLLLGWSVFHDNESLSKEIIVTLRTISSQESSRATACELGVIPLTIAAMKAFEKCFYIQGQGTSLLTSLAYESDKDKLAVCDEGGIIVVCRAMKDFPAMEYAQLQAKGCIFLRNMSAENSDGCARIVEEGGVDSILRAIDKFQRSAEVVEHGIAALGNLVSSPATCLQGNPEMFKKTLRVVSKLLVTTKDRMDKYAKVHERILALLGTAAKYDSFAQTFIGEIDAIPDIITILRIHMFPKLPKPASTSYSVVCRAAALLRCLAFQEQNRKEIVDVDIGVKCLTDSAMTLKNEAAQIEQALLAIGNTLFDSSEGKEAFARCNGVRIILDIMKEHAHVTGVQEACCLSLRAVCSKSAINAGEATKLGGITFCLHILRSFRENCVLQEESMSCLLVLVQNEPASTIIGPQETEMVKTVHQSVKAFPHSVTLRAQEELLLKFLKGENHEEKPKEQRGMRRRKLMFLPKKKEDLLSKYEDDIK